MRKPIRNSIIGVIFFIFITGIAGCNNLIPAPSITDFTTPWGNANSERVLEAEVNIPAGLSVDAIYVRYARHYWPGIETANDVEATPVEGTVNRYRANVPNVANFFKADHLFYEWFIDYRRGSSLPTFVRSAIPDKPHDFVVACSTADTQFTLDEIASVQSTFNDNYMLNPGYAGFAHLRPISLENQGVPMVNQGALLTAVLTSDGLNIFQPSLALFFPPPKVDAETEETYMARITDLIPDSGSKLAGIAYGVVQQSATRRPVLGCIPSSIWFIHEAGIHTLDGGITLYPVSENIPGETVVNSDSTPTDFPNPPQGQWHPRLWDMHFWFDVDGGLSTEINHPMGMPGLAVPTNTFFHAKTFE